MENSQFCSDLEITDYLNAALADLYDKLIAARGQNYYRSTNQFNTVANQTLYALPANFYQLISVDINVGSSVPTLSARKFQEEERNMFSLLPGWTYGAPIFYELQGSNIGFIPLPSGAYSVTLNYVPTFALLVNNGDTFDGVNGWEEYAIWSAVVACLQKEESDVTVPMTMIQKLETRIERLAEDRHAGASERVRDVTIENFGWGFGGDW